MSFNLRFPSHTVANCLASYGGRDDKYQQLNLERVALDMPNAYQYQGQALTVIGRRDDATGHGPIGARSEEPVRDREDHMSHCVLGNTTPHTPGEEGVQDHRLMEAIYRSAAQGQPVRLPAFDGRDRFRSV